MNFTFQNLLNLATNLAKILLELASVGSAVAVIWYGLRMAMARDDVAAFTAARKGLLLALVGVLIIFGVWTIIATVQGAVNSIGS